MRENLLRRRPSGRPGKRAMSQSHPATARGRPRTITRERLTDAGIEIGLPKVTILGIAAHLGVSAKALYKHVSGLKELKQQIAEEMFLRWELPSPSACGPDGLERFMITFSESMWQLVEMHPGIAPYMLREDLITPAMLAKMETHQKDVERVCGVTFAQSNWLLFIVAYFCVAVADTVLPLNGEKGTSSDKAKWVKSQYVSGARALIIGALATLNEVSDR
jgi:AcrR family transcriptional regulator